MLPRTKLWPQKPSLTPTFPLSLGSSKAGVPHSTVPLNKEAAFVISVSVGRFRGAALENSRDSPRRRQIKPKGEYKWRKRKSRKQAWSGQRKGGVCVCGV